MSDWDTNRLSDTDQCNTDDWCKNISLESPFGYSPRDYPLLHLTAQVMELPSNKSA